MSGMDLPAVESLALPTQARRHPNRVFISYAHDLDGRLMAAALRLELRQRGCEVVSDHDLPLRNTTSLPAWMDDQIANAVVLCVLSPDYLRAFEEVMAEGTAPRKGIRYEIRAVRQRIYDHRERDGCPVIPVISPQLDVELVPATLRSLDISRFDPETGSGIDQMLARVVALEGRGGSGAMNTVERVPPTSSRRMFRQVVYSLDDDLPSERALELVRECLRLAEDPELTTELLLAFPLIAEVIKDHGQVGLMRDLVAACLRKLHSAEPRLPEERGLEVRVLICGSAWCLQRDHRLNEALEEARKGIQLAERCEARRAAAFGKQSLGRIQRLLAEDSRGAERGYYLDASIRTLSEATALFSAIDGPNVRRSEVGACLSLSARTQLSRYRLLGDRSALSHADELAGQAGSLLALISDRQKKDKHDLKILRADIAAANRRYADSRKLLGDVIESLIGERAAPYSEILARAFATRARVALAARGARVDVMDDLIKARKIFISQELAHAAAVCTWIMLKIEPSTVTQLRVDRVDLRELEELTADPRVRLEAIAELERQGYAGKNRQAVGHRFDWATVVNQVRR